MTCQEVMDYMQRQLDDDLEDHEADALTAHTRYCSDCADMFERLKRLSAELDNLPKVVPAFSLVDAIIPQLDRIDSDRQSSGMAIDSIVSEPADEDTEAAIIPLSRRSSREREKGWLKRISWPAVTGVAAVGVAAGLFLVLFNPVNPPALKSDDSAKMETATTESIPAAESAAAADRSLSKQSSDEVRIESTQESGSNASVARKSPATKDQSPSPSDSTSSSAGGYVNKVAPYAEVPIYDQSGKDVPLAPGGESAAAGGAAVEGELKSSLNSSDVTMIAKDQHGELMGITSSGASADALTISNDVLSPDGTLSAAVVEGAVLVYTVQEGTVQLDSGKQTGVISGLQWSDDSKALFFEVKDDKGQSTHYKIDTRDWTIAMQ